MRDQLATFDGTLVSLLAYGGLRPEEAINIRWEHVGTRSLTVPRRRS